MNERYSRPETIENIEARVVAAKEAVATRGRLSLFDKIKYRITGGQDSYSEWLTQKVNYHNETGNVLRSLLWSIPQILVH